MSSFPEPDRAMHVAGQLWAMVTGFMSEWRQTKLLIEHAVAISPDTLHVLVGLPLWLLLALAMRLRVTAWRPWLFTFAIILWNETVDLWTEVWPDPGQQYGEGLKDLALTMFAPTVLLAATRLRPDLFRQGIGRRRKR